MTEDHDDTTVTRNDEAGRYEIRVGDVLGGFSEFFTDRKGRVVFPHTEIDPAFGGRGLGSTLVKAALTDAAARGETVRPTCPFVTAYLQKHDIDGLVVDWPRERPAAGGGHASGGGGV
ncbi:GNAT family N-acetyltransferase [Microbacterium sp. P01]|uniref:GNAT family N-acetyltransferase n=1 Tax=unclassified Microbacterium TaxID=2609290 RepID=UPI00366E4A28